MIEVRIASVLQAAEALRLAGRWEVASELLATASTSDPSEHAMIAVALADTVIDRAFWLGESAPDDVLDNASAAVETIGDEALRWDVDLLRLRRAYQPALRSVMSGGAVEAEKAQRFDEWAGRLQSAAPDGRRAGWAAFWGGVIADNLLKAPEAAFARYTTALGSAKQASDDLLASYALRHLGDHAYDRSDLTSAREQWETSTRLREKAGFVPGALAQRLLMGELLLAEGDRAGAAALAADVRRAAEATGVSWLAGAAAGLSDRARPDA